LEANNLSDANRVSLFLSAGAGTHQDAGISAEKLLLEKAILADIVLALSKSSNNALWQGIAMMKILVIEDEDSLRLAIRAMPRQHGYDVLAAGNGEKGLELARAHLPDLVLRDVDAGGRRMLGAGQDEDISRLGGGDLQVPGQTSELDTQPGSKRTDMVLIRGWTRWELALARVGLLGRCGP
jgi:hypothetical protein